jgi:hypothetical protein
MGTGGSSEHGGSADAATARAEATLAQALGHGVQVNLPAQRRLQQVV